MNSFLRWSPEVRDLLGPDVLATLRRTTTQFQCFSCHHPGNATRRRTHVVVLAPAQEPPSVQFAHAGCHKSTVITDLDDLDLTNPAGDGSEDVHSLTWLWPNPAGALAGLLIDRAVTYGSLDRDTGKLTDPWLASLTALGWEPVNTMDQGFPMVSTATIELDYPGGGRILTHAPKTILLQPLPDPTTAWMAAARQRGVVRVYAGQIGVRRGADLEYLMAAAISSGQIVGAYLPVS